jgi:hypothetical protein
MSLHNLGADQKLSGECRPLSLAQERIKFRIPRMLSAEGASLSHHCKTGKS